MMRIQTGEHYLNASDILQVNATILAGVLIFVTIASAASAASAKTSIPFLGIPIVDVYYFVTFAAAIPFVLSSQDESINRVKNDSQATNPIVRSLIGFTN
jgi:hypothetical protein